MTNVRVKFKKSLCSFAKRAITAYDGDRGSASGKGRASSCRGISGICSVVNVIVDAGFCESILDNGPGCARFSRNVVDDDESSHVQKAAHLRITQITQINNQESNVLT